MRTLLFWACLASIGAIPFWAFAQLRLATPDTVEFISRGTGDNRDGCGLSADYQFPGMILRVELMSWATTVGTTMTLKVLSPSSSPPPMRDIWFKTRSYFTLGWFKHARPNTKGHLESRGDLDITSSRAFLEEIAEGGGEISLIFEGTLPHARVPVRLPAPLPVEVKTAFESCTAKTRERT